MAKVVGNCLRRLPWLGGEEEPLKANTGLSQRDQQWGRLWRRSDAGPERQWVAVALEGGGGLQQCLRSAHAAMPVTKRSSSEPPQPRGPEEGLLTAFEPTCARWTPVTYCSWYPNCNFFVPSSMKQRNSNNRHII